MGNANGSQKEELKQFYKLLSIQHLQSLIAVIEELPVHEQREEVARASAATQTEGTTTEPAFGTIVNKGADSVFENHSQTESLADETPLSENESQHESESEQERYSSHSPERCFDVGVRPAGKRNHQAFEFLDAMNICSRRPLTVSDVEREIERMDE